MTARNDTALFGWVLMAIWTAMLIAITWIFVRDGGFGQFPSSTEAGILGAFWLIGFAGCVYTFRIPRVSLEIGGGGAVVRERWLMRQRVERLPRGSGTAPRLIEAEDSEGAPYFRCVITIPSGRTVTVAEHHHRAKVEAVRDRLRAELG